MILFYGHEHSKYAEVTFEDLCLAFHKLSCKIQNGRQGPERYLPLGFGCSGQLSLNKFFDSSILSMRKGRGGGEKQKIV